MARTVSVSSFQKMQSGGGDAGGDREIGTQDVAKVDPLNGGVVDAGPTLTEPTMTDELISLNVEANCRADMSRSLVVARVREASYGMRPAPSEEDIQAEADRIWTSFGATRPIEPKPEDQADELGERLAGRADKLARDLGGPREYDVVDGEVRDWRRPDPGPERDPFEPKVHQVGGEERFSGGGVVDGPVASKLVPTDAQFSAKLYRDAPELANIAERLIGEHGFLGELLNCEIRYFWRRKTGVSKGRVKIGYCKRASDLLGHFTGCDFIIWLSATTARDGKFTDRQIEAAVFHQLLHIETDDEGNFISARHDFEGFAQEIRHYGTWTEDLKLVVPAVDAARQMGLFDIGDDEGIEDDEEEAYFDAAGEEMGRASERPADPDQPFEGELDDLPTGEEIDASRRCPHGHHGCDGKHDLADDPLADHDV